MGELLAKSITVLAAVLGASTAIVASTAVPLAVALVLGATVTLGIRVVTNVRTYGTLSCVILFGLVAVTTYLGPLANELLSADRGIPPVAEHASAGGLLVTLAVVGLLLNEVLARADAIFDAGGTEAAGYHPVWALPSGILYSAIAGVRSAGVRGTGRYVAIGAVVCTAVGHALFVEAGAAGTLTEPMLAVSLVTILGLFTVFDGLHGHDGSGHGAFVDWSGTHTGQRRDVPRGTARWIDPRTVVGRAPVRGQTGGGGASHGRPDTDADTVVSRDDRRPGTAGGGSASAGRPDTDADTVVSRAGRGRHGHRESVEAESAATNLYTESDAGSGASATETRIWSHGGGTELGDQSGTDGDTHDGSSVAPAGCANCGRTGPTVAPRPLVSDPPDSATTNLVLLCDDCHNDRTTATPACEQSLPVDRDRVLRAAEQTCQCCGERAPAGQEATLELHPIVPLSTGGHRHEYNVVPLCPLCHGAAHV